MKRKALLMGMAVLAGLPAGASAKGIGKMDRGFHSYYAKYGSMAIRLTSHGQEVADPSVNHRKGEESVLSRFQSLLSKVSLYGYGAAGLAAENRGWRVEMLQPQLDIRLSESGDPRVNPREPLGLRLRYTF